MDGRLGSLEATSGGARLRGAGGDEAVGAMRSRGGLRRQRCGGQEEREDGRKRKGRREDKSRYVKRGAERLSLAAKGKRRVAGLQNGRNTETQERRRYDLVRVVSMGGRNEESSRCKKGLAPRARVNETSGRFECGDLAKRAPS